MGPNGIKDDTIYWRLHCGPLFMESTYCGKKHPGIVAVNPLREP